MRRLRALPVLLAMSVLWLPSTHASAAEPAVAAADRQTARSLMDEGYAHTNRGDRRGALESFTAADALVHAPTTGIAVARTQIALGLLVEARDRLVEISHTSPSPGEPAIFAEARAEARRRDVDVEKRIPWLQIRVVFAGPPSQVTVEVDGRPIPQATLGAARRLNPGEHVVIARTSAAQAVSAEVVLAEAERKEVVLDLDAVARPPEPVAPPRAPVKTRPASPDASASPSAPWTTVAFVGFGAGIVGLVTGTVAGVSSLTATDDVRAQCIDERCPPSVAGDLDSARGMATVSNVAFVVGALGIAAGVVGLVLGRSRPVTLGASPVLGGRF